MSGRELVLAFLLALPGVGQASAQANAHAQPQSQPDIRASALQAHLGFLSDDLLQGRAPGSRGADLAARYIAAQLMAAGIDAPRGGYLQVVPILAWTPETDGNTVDFAVRGRRLRALWGDHVVAWTDSRDSLVSLRAELVFVGYGVQAPEYRWDDFEGRDLRGKIALILAGDPPTPPTEPAAFGGRALTHHGRWDTKLEAARRHGAVGGIIIHSAAAAGYPWDVVRASFGATRYTLTPSSAAETPPLRLAGWLRVSEARNLLDAAGLNFDELLVHAARRDFAPVATGIEAHARLTGHVHSIAGHNVVGVVRGSERSHESVVYTAHYDHLGIGAAVRGDSIYNGAYDNASGVAAVLEIARAFGALETSPRRSVVFLFTTAEEAGLLGARRYVRAPALPLNSTVAVVNIDGANLWGETSDFVALGGERSTLGRVAETRGRTLGMRSAPDPAPELGLYFRSDHLPFALAGVPAIQIMHGDDYRGRPATWGAEMLARWNALRYHRPGDEYDAAFDLSGAVQQARLAFLIGYEVARSDQSPQWYDGGRPRTPPPVFRGPSGDR